MTNPVLYSVQLNLFQIDPTLPTGWSNPANMTLPTTATRPTFTVLGNKFSDIIGFKPETYTGASYISSFTPQASPVSSVLLGCSLIDNKYTNPSNIIYSFVSGTVPYGSMIHSQSNDLIFANIRDGVYNSMVIKFYDNNFNALDIIDNSLIIYLVIKIST